MCVCEYVSLSLSSRDSISIYFSFSSSAVDFLGPRRLSRSILAEAGVGVGGLIARNWGICREVKR